MGIALGQGAMRGVFQAGVVHAFIVSSYFPGVIAGTSAGAISGTTLALAAQLDDHTERLALAEAHIDLWLENPAQRVRHALVEGPLGNLVRDLGQIDITLGELAASAAGNPLAIVRLLLGLPLASQRAREGVLAALSGAFEGALHSLEGEGPLRERLSREVAMHAAQHVLAAYGMERALCATDAVQDHFERMIARFAPGGRGCTLEMLDRTELVLQTANLDRHTEEGESTVVSMARGGAPGLADFSGANLIAALRASCAFAPFFAGIRARELGMSKLPRGMNPDDLLLDAAVVARDPLTPVIDRWAHRAASSGARHRLFGVLTSPVDPVAVPKNISPFIGQALHSLKLRDELDQLYSAGVIETMTSLVDALRRKGRVPPERSNGGRYVSVDVSMIAPHAMLPFAGLSVPTPSEMREACAAGCRAALETLHADTLHGFEGEGPVPCERLLRKLRRANEAAFQPLSDVCKACHGMLERPKLRQPAIPEPERDALNDFPPFHEEARRKGGIRRPLQIAVPAGGVFLGVFQFGAIAALADYGIKPDLYAGASVGTIFSYLLENTLRDPSKLKDIVDLAITVPKWVDAVPGKEEGTLDIITSAIRGRWNSDEVKPLRDLRPRDIAAMLAAEPHGETAKTWERFRMGLGALFFTPLPDPKTNAPRGLPSKYRLDSDEWAHVHRTLRALTHLRLEGAVELLDEIAANLGFFTPGPNQDEGEIIGFESIAAQIRRIVFSGEASPTLAQHAAERGVRFIFTVTNHTRGQPECFGFADDSASTTVSPDAIEATLAASSFPLAFRRRSRKEIFHPAAIDHPEELYADGGILNNFPSDTAVAYLQSLTDLEDTSWIGEDVHQLILLSLTAPTTMEQDLPEHDGLVWNLARSLGRIDDEKVRKTVRGQAHVRALAQKANPILRQEGERQAIQTEVILITPSYGIYPHAFAFKPYLGFDAEKQQEMLASGCRRARLALEWAAHQKAYGGRRRLPQFIDDVRAEVRKVERWRSDYPENTCLFGRFSPGGQGVQCPFTKHEAGGAVYERCKATIDRELSVRNLKL